MKIGELPDSEIGEINLYDDMPSSLTYPEILPILFRRVLMEIKEVE